MSEEMKKKMILKLELYDDGTSVTEQDLLGMLAYLQKVANEGGKTVDVIADVICRVGVAVEKKSHIAHTEVERLRREARDIADEDKLGNIRKERDEKNDKINSLASKLHEAEETIKDLEARLKTGKN